MALGNLIFQFPNEVENTIRKIEKILLKINAFASTGRTGTSNIFLLKSAGRRTGASNEKSTSKVSLYISRNMVSFFFLLWF